MDVQSNVAKFFSDENRSMMGGWTAPALEAAKLEAMKLTGSDRAHALAEIEARVARESDSGSSEAAA